MAFIQINKANFFHNLEIIAQKTKGANKIALVLKDNAYGHGLCEIAKLASEFGITKAVVRNEAEAKQIASNFCEILILADTPKESKANFDYTINSLEQIPNFPKATKVHLKVDSGMHRNGISMHELEDAFKAIKKAELKLAGVFSHHRNADELTAEWFWQNQNFATIVAKSKELAKLYGFDRLTFHIDNSASLFRSQKLQYDFARIGIAAYGVLDMPTIATPELKPILSLYAQKIASRKLQAGERVGYGGSFEAPKSMQVATYDIGYGDGFVRALSNNYTTPDGYRVLGKISMDNTTFDTTKEEIVVFNDARVVAKKLNTIAYEVLTNLKEHLQRTIIES